MDNIYDVVDNYIGILICKQILFKFIMKVLWRYSRYKISCHASPCSIVATQQQSRDLE